MIPGPEGPGSAGPSAARFSPVNSLEQVAQRVRSCTDCPLGRGRTNAVPGEGNPQAEVMFIGERPGYQENRQGRPFVGPAGKLLEGLLASIGSNRDDVFIANPIWSNAGRPITGIRFLRKWPLAPNIWIDR